LKKTVKHIIALLCIAFIIVLVECKKDNAQPYKQNHTVNHDSLSINQTDPSDSLVGTYNCINHHLYQTSNGYMDTIIGPATLFVSKLPSDTTGLVINGDTLHFYNNTYLGPQTIGNPWTAKFSPGPPVGINFDYADYSSLAYTDYYYYIGHKN
jgi:hypothetical protein